MAPKGKSINVPSTSKADRKRGRPAGKNRAPLSLEERRARNAKYEKERRVEMAAGMVELAEAAGCDPQITNTELLAQVISRLQSLEHKQSNQEIKRVNNSLIRQIDILTKRIKADPDLCNNLDPDSDTDDSSSSSESENETSDEESSSSGSSSEEEARPAKIIKTEDCSTNSEEEVTIQENINNTSSTEENLEPFTEFSFMTLFAGTEGDILEEAVCSATTFFQSMEMSEGQLHLQG